MTVVDISLFYGENCMLSEITEKKLMSLSYMENYRILPNKIPSPLLVFESSGGPLNLSSLI